MLMNIEAISVHFILDVQNYIKQRNEIDYLISTCSGSFCTLEHRGVGFNSRLD